MKVTRRVPKNLMMTEPGAADSTTDANKNYSNIEDFFSPSSSRGSSQARGGAAASVGGSQNVNFF